MSNENLPVSDINAEPPEGLIEKDVTPKKTEAPKPIVVGIDSKGLFSFNNHNELMHAATMALQLEIVPKKLKESGGKIAAAAALMFCKQFNLPLKAMNEMGWIEGCLTVYGSLYWALAERHPEFGEYDMYWIDKEYNKLSADNKNLHNKVWAAVLKIKKKNSDVWNEYFFTMDEAEKAELYPPMKNEWVNNQKTGKKIPNTQSPWYKYEKDMLMHKVKKRGLDANYASALNGCVYHEDAKEFLEKEKDVTPLDLNKKSLNELLT